MDFEENNKNYRDAVNDFKKKLKNFLHILEEGTKDPEHFISIDKIEEEWANFNRDTKCISDNVISNFLSNLDENKIIIFKKKNVQ